jgi:peroxiredoxin
MKKAVLKYEADNDIKFLFVDTWEQKDKDDTKIIVQEFLKENRYPFHVLMDSDSKMVESFGVNAIPAKFVIDKKGNMRFKTVGFEGTDESLLDELDIILELIKG